MNGKAHSVLTVGLAGAILYTCTELNIPVDVTGGLVTGCLANLFVHPDLDQAEIRTLKRPWLISWWPYGKLIKHRSPLSHFPVIGTLGRVLYITLVVALVGQIMRVPAPTLKYEAKFIIAGLMMADTLHYLADLVSTFWKKFWR